MDRSRWKGATRALALAGALAAATCIDATDVDLLEFDADGTVFGIVYLDADGDGEQGFDDTPMRGLRVVLATGRGTVVQDATTDTTGLFILRDVPVGSYALTLPPETVGDSLQVAEDGVEVMVERGDTTRVDVPVSYPILTPEEVASFPVGRRIITSGIALNSRLPFGDGRVHIRGAETRLRALDVARLSLSAGDSVRLIGRTALSAGRPVLTGTTAVVLVAQATIPVPDEVTTEVAAAADGGRLDAGLVRIRNASISDTMTVDGDFHFTADDGSGPVEVVVQSFLQLPAGTIQPDTVFRVARLTGLLVPTVGSTGTRWRILPRAASDLSLEARRVDLGLSMNADFTTASRNDTITFRLVARNEGGLAATNVQVLDSLPLGITLLDATPSRGTFQASTGLWTLGTMPVGASDTLRIRTRVSTSLTGTFVHRARYLPLTNEIDTNASNDLASASIQIVTLANKRADLQVEVTANPSAALPGDTVRFTVLALNGGPLKVSAVGIVDSLPAGLTLIDAQPSRGTFDAATGIWRLDSIPVAATESLQIRARVTVDTAAVLVNRVRSLGVQRETDPVATNDTASATVQVTAFRASDIGVTASADRTTVAFGDTVELRVTARNAGPLTARAVQVLDTLPGGLAFLSATATRGSYEPGTATWSLDSIAIGATETLRIRAQVTATPPDSLRNRVRSLGPARPGIDTVSANDTASVGLTVVVPSQAGSGVVSGTRPPAGPHGGPARISPLPAPPSARRTASAGPTPGGRRGSAPGDAGPSAYGWPPG